MRVLIISTYRCGGNSFTSWIAEELKSDAIFEPYDYSNENKIKNKFWIYNKQKYHQIVKSFDFFNEDNIVVKIPYNDSLEPIDSLINKFDKSIAITRDNIRESAESMLWAKQNDQWQKKYKINDDWIKNNINEIENEMKSHCYMNLKVKNLPILQVTYENLFQERTDIIKVEDFLDIKYNHCMDEENKLRNGKKSFI